MPSTYLIIYYLVWAPSWNPNHLLINDKCYRKRYLTIHEDYRKTSFDLTSLYLRICEAYLTSFCCFGFCIVHRTRVRVYRSNYICLLQYPTVSILATTKSYLVQLNESYTMSPSASFGNSSRPLILTCEIVKLPIFFSNFVTASNLNSKYS